MVKKGESKKLKNKLSIKKSLELNELEPEDLNGSVNDELWTCTVAMIIEKNSDYTKFIKSFEQGAKIGAHSVIKNINFKELEEPTSKPKTKTKSSSKAQKTKIGNKKTVSKPENVMELSKARMTAEKVLKFILRSKKEDLAAIKSRYMEIDTCGSQDNISPLKVVADNEKIHNEPLCGPSLYFVLTGFYNSEIVEELLKLRIPLDAIVAFNKPNEENEKLINKGKQDSFVGFWSGFAEFSTLIENKELISNLIVYECDPKESVIGKENLKAKDTNDLIYDYTVQQLYNIQKEKRRYVHFIKSIYNVRVAEVKKIHVSSINHYNSLVRSIPLEVVTIDHILNCLVEQIVIDANSCDPLMKHIEEVMNLESKGNNVSEKNLELEVLAESRSSKSGSEDHRSNLSVTNKQKNITPFIIEHKNSRGVNLINFQEYYLKFADYYLAILERLKCPLLWEYFPVVNKEIKLLSISHYQKIREFHEKPDKVLIEACIHKRLLNKVFLGMTDSRNLDAICHDVLDGYYGCINCDSFLSEEESKGVLGKTSDQPNVDYDEQIMDKDQYRDPSIQSISRDLLDFADENPGMEKNTSAEVMKTNNLIFQSNKGLNELNDFLSCPELDNLFLECYNALKNYTVLESFSKNTSLHLLNVYSTVYDFVDYLYYTPTDSIIFVFHHGVDKDGLINRVSNYHLLTPISFRDYYLNKIYSSWIQTQDDAIREEDETSMKKLKVITGVEDLERCCYYNINKFGLFPTEASPKQKYQLHVPHPPAELRDELEGATFIGYDMGISSYFQSNESSTSYISNTGARVTCTNYALFNSSEVHHISFNHPSITINYDICPDLNSKQKIVVDTSDHIRIIISFISNSSISANNRSDKRKSNHFEQTNLEESPEEKESQPNNIIVVLENGLEITLYQINNKIMGIKQRHLEPNSRSANNSEKYRIYLKDGSVMIFKDDGSIIVYYLNTTITEINKVASEKEFIDICGTAPPIHNESKAMGGSRNASILRTSMTDDLFFKNNKTEPHYVIAEHKVLTWSGISNHYKYGFCVSSWEEHNIRTAQIPGAELYTSRSDGTKSLLNAEGELVVEYPDGTRITSTPRTHLVVGTEESDDSMEFGDKSDDEVWIYVTLGYLIEEPTNYLPVKYFGNEWTIFLPGKKGLYFSEKAKTVLTLGKLNTVLNIDFMKGSVIFGYSDILTNVFCSFFISLIEKENEPICKFADEEHLIEVDKQGNISLVKSTEHEVRERSMSIFQTLHADSVRYVFLSALHSASQGQEIKSISESSNSTEEDSLYAIKPEERQKNVKLFYLRRDLTGGEFIPDSENCLFNEESKTADEPNNFVNYSDSLYDVFLWSPYTPGQTDQHLKSCKVPYSVPHCFYVSDLHRCNLSKPNSVKQVWLFEQINRSATNVTPAISSTVLNNTQERIDSFLEKSSSRKQRHNNQSVTLIRRIIDLKKIGDSDQMLQNSLALYLDYKKKIYTSILRNALDEIKAQNKSNTSQNEDLQQQKKVQ